MKFCKDCWNFSRCNAVGRTVDFAVDDGVCCEFDEVKNMTNADRIRAMSDEELYIWAKKQIGCGFDFFPCGVVCDGKCESFDEETCKAKIMDWLQQPAGGE